MTLLYKWKEWIDDIDINIETQYILWALYFQFGPQKRRLI